jgi:hypothetical protein
MFALLAGVSLCFLIGLVLNRYKRGLIKRALGATEPSFLVIESGAGLEKLKIWNIKFSIQEIEAHPSHLPGPFAKTFVFKAGRL